MEQTKFPAVTNMVLFSEPVTLTKQKLEAAAQAHGVQNFSVNSQEGQDGAYIFFLGESPFIILSVDQPVPQQTFNRALQFSFGLDNPEQVISKQNSHVIISPLKKTEHMGQGIMGAIGVTEVSAIVSRVLEPVGHYWSHSDTLVSQKQFKDNLQGVRKSLSIQMSGESGSGSHLPRLMWVGFRLLGSSEQGIIGAGTLGLAAFTGYELEISPVSLPAEILAQRIYGTVEYLFNNGPVLQDGHTLGVSETERFRLLMVDSTADTPPRFLMTLENVGV